MKIILAGPDRTFLTRHAYPAMTSAGFDVLAVVDTPEKLRDVAGAVDLAIVEANIAATPDAAIELLSGMSTQVAVILPAMWASERKRFADLPHLVAGFTAPVAWPNVIAKLRERIKETNPPTGQGTSDADIRDPAANGPVMPAAPIELPPDPERSPIRGKLPVRDPVLRLGFYGKRGGVGVSTAALTAARALSGEGKRVALFDAARRGDVHLMAGIQPSERTVTHESITFFLCPPNEEHIRDFDAVIVDGGRACGTFNANWVAVSRPVPKDKVLHLVGIEPREDENVEQSGERTLPRRSAPRERRKPRKRGLGKLISIEVTE